MRVYFVEAVGLDLIKIGVASDVDARFSALQSGSPVPLRLLGTVPGDRKLERLFHGLFAAHRTHGEWFRRCAELDNLIDGANRPYVPCAAVQNAIDRAKRAQSHRMRLANYGGAP